MRRHRLSPALILAGLALFVAVGSSSIAESARNLITGKDVKNGSLRLADFRKADRQKLAGRRGPAGPAGAKGDKGDPGDKGDIGLTGPPGTAVRARMRFDGAVPLGFGVPTNIPLEGATFTQQAGETLFLLGEIVADGPPDCGGANVALTVTWSIDQAAQVIHSGYGTVGTGATGAVNPVPGPVLTGFPGTAFIFEPSSDTPRTLTFKAYDNCNDPVDAVTVRNVRINAFALK